MAKVDVKEEKITIENTNIKQERLEEVCQHCNGKCFISGSFCQFCGGYGVNTWIGNMMGKPERLPVEEVIERVISCLPFGFQVNPMLEKEFHETNLVVKLESMEKGIFNMSARKRGSDPK